jgi:hypothetical protein
MGQETRNHSVAGVVVLAGAAMIAFGATQPWATGAVTLRAWVRDVTPRSAWGFDLLLGPDGQYGDVTPLLIGGVAVLGVSALLLLVTRVPVVGILWRLLAVTTVVGLGLISVPAWGVVNDPPSVVGDPGSPTGEAFGLAASVAQSSGLLGVEPGVGLWLLTIGTGVAGIGALVPAIRGRTPEVEAALPSSTAVRMPAGWYPDQLEGSIVRFFDGVRWTGATRPRS